MADLFIDEDNVWVKLSGARTIGAPLAWFPGLLHADPVSRQDFELSVHGIHWDALDEDISIKGLLAGLGDQTRRNKKRAA